MKYSAPTLAPLGTVHALTLHGGDDDYGRDDSKPSGKCLGVGDGYAQEVGWS